MSAEVTTSYIFNVEDESDHHTAVVSVAKFSKLFAIKKSEAIITKIFQGNSDLSFQIKIVLVGHNNDTVEIYFSSSTPIFLKAVLTLCLQRYQDRSIALLDYQTIAANKWKYLTNLYRRDMELNPVEYYLSEDTLRFKLKLIVCNTVSVVSTIPKMQLSKDFEGLLESGLFSDLVMISSDGMEFRVHKNIIASRSTVLRALLENDMSEKRTNIVESPFDGEILQQILTYMYSERSPRMEAISEKLLAGADYYLIDGLKYICEEALFRNVTVENCIEFLQLADLHLAKNLKHMIYEFIKDGNQRAIIETETWKKINSVDIVKNLYEFIISEGVKRVAL